MNEIDEIKARILIPDIAAKVGIEFNRSGFAKSIYKEQRTPSMKYYPANNSYYCFATSQGGSVIDFYRDLYNLDDATAIKELKQLAGIDGSKISTREPVAPAKLQEENFETALSADEKYIYEERIAMNETASDEDAKETARREVQKHRIEKNAEVFHAFRKYVMIHDINFKAIKYLTDERKLDLVTVERKGAFAFINYNKVSDHLKKTFPPEQLQRSGLFNEKNNLIFYKHRLIIPYFFNNRITYLRARYFDENDNHQTDDYKYLGLKNDALNVNSPKRFYNIDRLNFLPEGKRLFIVEGEFDALAFESGNLASIAIVGVGNVPDRSKFKQLLKFDNYIVVDNDVAGLTLKDKLVEIYNSYKAPFRVRILTNHKDINDLLKNIIH